MSIMLAAMLLVQDVTPFARPGEEAVEPYAVSNANADAAPFDGEGMLDAFHGQAGIRRIVDGLVDRSVADPRIMEIFMNLDMVRLRRTLFEQLCYIINGGCDYSGRTMAEAHRDLGAQRADMNALVENLQAAMAEEGVPFAAQNRLLARLAPMHRDVVTR